MFSLYEDQGPYEEKSKAIDFTLEEEVEPIKESKFIDHECYTFEDAEAYSRSMISNSSAWNADTKFEGGGLGVSVNVNAKASGETKKLSKEELI